MMNAHRRRLLGAGAAAMLGCGSGPLLAKARRNARLAMLFLEPVTPDELVRHSTMARLAELGWREGTNLSVERAFANADRSVLPQACERLVQGKPDAIWTDEFDSALELSRRTSTVPIVFCGVAQPVEQGLIASYARPGRNLTGVAHITGMEVSVKRAWLLRDIVPSARRLAWIYPSWGLQSTDGRQFDLTPYEAEARKSGYEPAFYPVGSVDDLHRTFNAILERRTEALSCGSNPVLIRGRERIVAFANANRIPSTFLEPSFVESGGLLSFGPDRDDVRRKTAELIDRILNGADPAVTPVERPQRFVTAVNARTAQSLGLALPQSLLLQADLVVR